MPQGLPDYRFPPLLVDILLYKQKTCHEKGKLLPLDFFSRFPAFLAYPLSRLALSFDILLEEKVLAVIDGIGELPDPVTED